jgi:hypothetical protein
MNFVSVACACMGIRIGDQYCYCELKARGLDTSHYEWSEEEKKKLNDALSEMFNWKTGAANENDPDAKGI